MLFHWIATVSLNNYILFARSSQVRIGSSTNSIRHAACWAVKMRAFWHSLATCLVSNEALIESVCKLWFSCGFCHGLDLKLRTRLSMTILVLRRKAPRAFSGTGWHRHGGHGCNFPMLSSLLFWRKSHGFVWSQNFTHTHIYIYLFIIINYYYCYCYYYYYYYIVIIYFFIYLCCLGKNTIRLPLFFNGVVLANRR